MSRRWIRGRGGGALLIALVAGGLSGCGADEPEYVERAASPAASQVEAGPGAPTFETVGRWPAGDRATAVTSMLGVDPVARPALEDSSALDILQPPADGFFDSLSVATGGNDPGAWRSRGVFVVHRGTAEVYADTATGWFTLVFRDGSGAPRWNPVFRPGLEVVGSSPAAGRLYLFGDEGGSPALHAVRVRWGPS